MKAVDGSLSRLNTDHVDLVHIHSCDTIDRLLDENAHEAFDRLKEQGKVRFLGVSTHTPDLETIASAAIESDRFDVMMLAYHYGAWPGTIVVSEHHYIEAIAFNGSASDGFKVRSVGGDTEESYFSLLLQSIKGFVRIFVEQPVDGIAGVDMDEIDMIRVEAREASIYSLHIVVYGCAWSEMPAWCAHHAGISDQAHP